MNKLILTFITIFACCSTDIHLLAQITPKSILFIRGGDRSGGFLEAGNDFDRTEHLGDIFNSSTSGGNHGWAELRQTLESVGYELTQLAEESETSSGPANGAPVDFTTLDLGQYDVIVMGSNNAVYETAQADAFETYIREGGSALFISDANFGGSWADAPRSDQQFLNRFGITVGQDQGTYSLFRDQEDYLTPDHPVLVDVDRFDGEGVSPFVVIPENLTEGVTATILARAKNQTRINEPPFGTNEQGGSRATTATDASIVAITADEGRIIGHFDRNTFFNNNGAGTNINRFDNRQLAMNIFSWLTESDAPDESFTAWLTLFFREEQLQDPEISGPTVDYDNDGLANFAEYLLVGDPTLADPEIAPVIEVIEGHLTLTYSIRTISEDTVVSAEVISDISQSVWLSGIEHLEYEILETTNNFSQVRARDRIPLSSNANRFMRLRLEF